MKKELTWKQINTRLYARGVSARKLSNLLINLPRGQKVYTKSQVFEASTAISSGYKPRLELVDKLFR